ncbi:hypothetical protein Taro_031144 [Colocasia esculenta]|uniref:Transposase n=1 Tax=Colocasia esculenta TaxID=4460 RepID=A0A843VR31_COLES|nr:hypothetical protein [Colocasia esculenta]
MVCFCGVEGRLIVEGESVAPKRKFHVPISLSDFVMKDLDQKWRSWKYDLRTKFFTPYQKAQQHVACSDTRVVEDQWKNLIQIWSSDEFKKRSDINKQNKFKHTFFHCAGSKSLADIYHEEDKIRDIKLTQQSSTSSSVASVGDIYEQVMGRDRTGRVRGIGTGPTPKNLWGSRSEQKLRQDNESLKEKIDALEERMKKIESRGNNEDSLAGRRVRILNFSRQVVASGILMSDDNDNVVMEKKLGDTPTKTVDALPCSLTEALPRTLLSSPPRLLAVTAFVNIVVVCSHRRRASRRHRHHIQPSLLPNLLSTLSTTLRRQ